MWDQRGKVYGGLSKAGAKMWPSTTRFIQLFLFNGTQWP